MPNVNLIEEEGGGEGGMQPIAAPMKRRGGGGGGSKVLLIVVILIIVGGGVFALNKFGIIKLWGKKPAPVVVAQLPEDQYAADQFTQTDSTMMADTSGVSFVDTPPLTEAKEPEMTGGLVTDRGGKSTRLSGGASTPVSSRLNEMSGNYTIQVSAWRDRGTAETYVKRLEEAGYPAFVEERSMKNGSWYTVRIGRYSSIKEAKKAVDSFAYELKNNYWIDRVRAN
jgi:hypothetical protein